MCVNCLQVKAHLYRTDYVSATNSEENRRFFELGIRRVASGIRRVTSGIRRGIAARQDERNKSKNEDRF